MPNCIAAAAFRAFLVVTLWFQEAPLQSGRAHAQMTCESQPCDCNGVLLNPDRSIKLGELEQSIAAHQKWLSDRVSDPEHWTLEEQIKQYYPKHNPPNSDERKYYCSRQKNGTSFLARLELSRSIAQTDALARTDLRGACFRKSDVRNVILNNTNLRGAIFTKLTYPERLLLARI